LGSCERGEDGHTDKEQWFGEVMHEMFLLKRKNGDNQTEVILILASKLL
jgi:hypothetical protein